MFNEQRISRKDVYFIYFCNSKQTLRLASVEHDGNYKGFAQSVLDSRPNGVAESTSVEPSHWCCRC